MNTRDDRDRTVDRLLRQAFEASDGSAAPGASCLDAETLAAWAEGSLSQGSLTAVEAHLSDCSRCQRIVAVLGKIPAATPEARPWWHWGVDLRWLIPLAAGATAVALWVAVPGTPPSVVPAVGSRQSPVGSPQSAVPSPQSPVASPQSPVGSPQSPGDRQPSAAELRSAAPAPSRPTSAANEKGDATPAELRDARKEETDAARPAADSLGRLGATARVTAPAAAPAAEAAAGNRTDAFSLARQTAVITQEVASPAPLIRWRIGPRGLLQYTASGGTAWEAISSSVATDLLAGASPSASVCWVVGAGGTVLLTVDGRRFDRIPFTVTVDLVAVAATDARSATVTASDGRTFRTTDGGSTWVP